MKYLRRIFVCSLAIAGMIGLTGCQGELDTNITDMFDTYAENASVSGMPSGGNLNGGNNGGNSGKQSEAAAKKLIGTWIETSYQFQDEEKITYKNSDRYIVFLPDYTIETHPYNLFENNISGESWVVSGNKLIFNNDPESTFLFTVSSSTLTMCWLEHGDPIEKVTFKKAN